MNRNEGGERHLSGKFPKGHLVPVPGKKQVRNITSWICDGKFVKAMSIAKRIFLAFINISFFDGELNMCLSLIWYCL